MFEVQVLEDGEVTFRYMERLKEQQQAKLFILNLEDSENNIFSTAFICDNEFSLRQRCVIDIGKTQTWTSIFSSSMDIYFSDKTACFKTARGGK